MNSARHEAKREGRFLRSIAAALTMTALAACAANQAKPAATNHAASFDKNPYPSTYKPYPATPTALVGATVYAAPAGGSTTAWCCWREAGSRRSATRGWRSGDYARIDAAGRFVTPGIIDHPQPPRRLSQPRGDLAFGRQRGDRFRLPPPSGPSIRSGRRIQGSAARSPTAGSPRCKSCRARPT